MIIIFVLIGFAVCVALFLIGVAWVVLMFLPFYLFVAGVLLLVFQRHRRRQQMHAYDLLLDGERERRLNAQELGAWQSAATDTQRKADKRANALKKFDLINPEE